MKKLTLGKSNFLRRLMYKVFSNLRKTRLISNCYKKKIKASIDETAFDKFSSKEYKIYIRTWRKTVFFDSLIIRDI